MTIKKDSLKEACNTDSSLVRTAHTTGWLYLAGSYGRFLFPDYPASLQPADLVPLAAELSFCFGC